MTRQNEYFDRSDRLLMGKLSTLSDRYEDFTVGFCRNATWQVEAVTTDRYDARIFAADHIPLLHIDAKMM